MGPDAWPTASLLRRRSCPMARRVLVEQGQVVVSNNPEEVLEARGIASCVAVCVHDARARAGGIAYIMMPSSLVEDEGCPAGAFADRAVRTLMSQMATKEASSENCQITLVGGAEMLGATASDAVSGLGRRNIQAVESLLRTRRLGVANRHLGGHRARDVGLRIADGQIAVAER